MQIMYCGNCNGHSISEDSVSFVLEMSHSNWCSHCRHSNNRKHLVFFCSSECLLEYMRNPEKEKEFIKTVNKFKADRLWDHNFKEKHEESMDREEQ